MHVEDVALDVVKCVKQTWHLHSFFHDYISLCICCDVKLVLSSFLSLW